MPSNLHATESSTGAETQGEWIKSLVAARGFPRNGWQQLPPPIAVAVGRPEDATTDEDEEDDAFPPSGSERLVEFGLSVVQLVNNLMAQFGSPPGSASPAKAPSGGSKLPSLGALFDWRKAMPANERSEDAAQRAELPPAPDGDVMPPLDAKTMAHFIAIQAALKPDEAAMARAVAGELGPVELRAWFEDLKKLSVPDAVTKIRSLIGKGVAS